MPFESCGFSQGRELKWSDDPKLFFIIHFE
jgi:hypothetical protein